MPHLPWSCTSKAIKSRKPFGRTGVGGPIPAASASGPPISGLIRTRAAVSQRSTSPFGTRRRSESQRKFFRSIVSLRACSNRSPWSMANLIPESFQLIELLVWLGVGIIGAALAGLAAGLIPRKRQQSLGPGTIAGFVTAAIILLVSNPDGGRGWVMWAAIGSAMGAGAGTGAAWLVEKVLDHQDRAASTP